MRVIGVDFSGAEPETGKTWIAEGSLSDGGFLTLTCCHPITRADLTRKLAALEEPAVVAMDFPFSVPEVFAAFWHCNRPSLVPYDGNMTHLWAAAHKMGRNAFVKFVTDEWKGEPNRFCDLEIQRKLKPFSQVFSPLRHSNNPSMLQMTVEGMQMLNLLQGKSKVRIPPLHPVPEQDSITLLEIMPGATLRSFGLPYRGYKSGQNPLKNRDKILRELSQKMISLTPLPRLLTLTCRANEDALDAVVAVITAALWHKDRSAKSFFCYPPDPGQPNYGKVQLEGWLYAPKPLEGN